MKFIQWPVILLFLFSCSSHTIKKNDLHEDVIIAGKLKGSQYRDIYFSGQPKNTDYKKLSENGFKTVINLRSKDEYKEEVEQWLVEKKYKMNYYNIAFEKNMELNDSFIDNVTSAVKKHRKEGKTLIHCSTGNRVGAWLAAHFHKDHKMSKEESLETAKKMGLTKEKAIKKVEHYFLK